VILVEKTTTGGRGIEKKGYALNLQGGRRCSETEEKKRLQKEKRLGKGKVNELSCSRSEKDDASRSDGGTRQAWEGEEMEAP